MEYFTDRNEVTYNGDAIMLYIGV